MRLVDTPGASGRLVLLAGGTSTIGPATAGALLEAGARVVIAGRDKEKLARAHAIHREVNTAQVDLTDEERVLK